MPALVRTIACATCLAVSGCASAAIHVPQNVTVGADRGRTPAPPVRASAALPAIVAIHFDSLEIARPSTWSGSIVASTNTASVEIRTNLFSIVANRKGFGRFAFAVDVYDLPSIFLRDYRLRVIARNAAGAVAEEDLPLRLR
jgi:hypothetical protein